MLIVALHGITPEEIETVCADAEKYGAATLAVPVKDTIKVAAADGTVCATPERSTCVPFRRRRYSAFLCIKKRCALRKRRKAIYGRLPAH